MKRENENVYARQIHALPQVFHTEVFLELLKLKMSYAFDDIIHCCVSSMLSSR